MHNQFTAFELAQMASALAPEGADPRLYFPRAKDVLTSAQRYLSEGVTAIVEHAKSPADLALLGVAADHAAVGWEKLLMMLDEAVWKREGRDNRMTEKKEVETFLISKFPDQDSNDGGEKIVLSKGKLFIHQLDGERLSLDEANRIASKWKRFRKERTRKASLGKTRAAENRMAAAARRKDL
jgi:hypothetical protein